MIFSEFIHPTKYNSWWEEVDAMRPGIQNDEAAESYVHSNICTALPVAEAQALFSKISSVKDMESISMEFIKFGMGYLDQTKTSLICYALHLFKYTYSDILIQYIFSNIIVHTHVWQSPYL